jgi:hypothetical protein
MKRLILATLCGTFVSAVILTLSLSLADERAITLIRTLHGVTTPLGTFGFVLGFLIVFGALPAILLGAVLRYFSRASPVTLVLTPAILFLLTLAEITREMADVSLAYETLPAMIVGGGVMFQVLVTAKIPQNVEAAFE